MPYTRPIPKPNKRVYYVIVFRRMYYWHRGIWPTRDDARRNAEDLDPDGVEIKRCWVATE